MARREIRCPATKWTLMLMRLFAATTGEGCAGMISELPRWLQIIVGLVIVAGVVWSLVRKRRQMPLQSELDAARAFGRKEAIEEGAGSAMY